MKCAKCGCETDYAIFAALGWYVIEDGKILLIEGLSPARRERVLCVDCFGRCAEVFKKEDA